MIEQYLSNTNEIATVLILLKNFATKQGIVVGSHGGQEVVLHHASFSIKNGRATSRSLEGERRTHTCSRPTLARSFPFRPAASSLDARADVARRRHRPGPSKLLRGPHCPGNAAVPRQHSRAVQGPGRTGTPDPGKMKIHFPARAWKRKCCHTTTAGLAFASGLPLSLSLALPLFFMIQYSGYTMFSNNNLWYCDCVHTEARHFATYGGLFLSIGGHRRGAPHCTSSSCGLFPRRRGSRR